MRLLPPAAAMAAALLAAAPPAPALQDDPLVLKINPFRKGLDGWERTGAEKAFAYAAEETSLAVKGQSGKEPPRLVYAKIAWDSFTLAMQVKSGTRKVSVVLVPQPSGDPLRLEIPRNAVKSGKWGDVSLVVGGGKAELRAPEGEEEKVLASADLPADRAFRFGFEAPSGADGVVSNLRLERRYADSPQICEEGFESTFPGDSLGGWVPARPEMASVFRAENGLLIGEVRTEDYGWIVLPGRRYKAYELRMRALWPSNSLEIRALEAPGADGKVNKFDTVQVNVSDNLDPENVNDIVVRLDGGKCAISVNGKKVVDDKVKPDAEPTIISLLIARGKRVFLRDIRIKDLAPGEGGEGFGGRRDPAPEEAKEPEAPKTRWTATGGFAEKDGGFEVEAAADAGAGLLCGSTTASYTLRFKVAAGAEGLSIVPRANRGVDRSAGIRLAEALFEGREWTEVVVTTRLLDCRVTVNGEKAGGLELDDASGPPGIRVAGLGKARIRDLVFEAVR